MIETTENAVGTDGIDPSVIDLDPSETVVATKTVATPKAIATKPPLATLTETEMLRIDVFTAQAGRIAAERESLKQAQRALNAEESIMSANQGTFFSSLQEKYGISFANKQVNVDGTVVDRIEQ